MLGVAHWTIRQGPRLDWIQVPRVRHQTRRSGRKGRIRALDARNDDEPHESGIRFGAALRRPVMGKRSFSWSIAPSNASAAVSSTRSSSPSSTSGLSPARPGQRRGCAASGCRVPLLLEGLSGRRPPPQPAPARVNGCVRRSKWMDRSRALDKARVAAKANQKRRDVAAGWSRSGW